MNQISTSTSSPAASVVLPMLATEAEVFEVPTYQTVDVIIPRELAKELKGMTTHPQALELARILRENADDLPLIAVISVNGVASGELRFQSARTGDLLLVGEKEYRDWKEGRPEGLLNVLTAALAQPVPFAKIDYNAL